MSSGRPQAHRVKRVNRKSRWLAFLREGERNSRATTASTNLSCDESLFVAEHADTFYSTQPINQENVVANGSARTNVEITD